MNNGSGSNNNVPQPRMDKEQLLQGLAQIMNQAQQGQPPTQEITVQAQDPTTNKNDASMEVPLTATINSSDVVLHGKGQDSGQNGSRSRPQYQPDVQESYGSQDPINKTMVPRNKARKVCIRKMLGPKVPFEEKILRLLYFVAGKQVRGS